MQNSQRAHDAKPRTAVASRHGAVTADPRAARVMSRVPCSCAIATCDKQRFVGIAEGVDVVLLKKKEIFATISVVCAMIFVSQTLSVAKHPLFLQKEVVFWSAFVRFFSHYNTADKAPFAHVYALQYLED